MYVLILKFAFTFPEQVHFIGIFKSQFLKIRFRNRGSHRSDVKHPSAPDVFLLSPGSLCVLGCQVGFGWLCVRQLFQNSVLKLTENKQCFYLKFSVYHRMPGQ